MEWPDQEKATSLRNEFVATYLRQPLTPSQVRSSISTETDFKPCEEWTFCDGQIHLLKSKKFFRTLDEVENILHNESVTIGFTTARKHVNRNTSNDINNLAFVCSRSGKHIPKNPNSTRRSAKTDCPFVVTFSRTIFFQHSF